MTPDNSAFQTTRRHERTMAAVAALTASVAINGAVLLCFDATSPDLWLVPTPALASSLARCDAKTSRAAQTDCKQQVLAARQASDRQGLRLAGR